MKNTIITYGLSAIALGLPNIHTYANTSSDSQTKQDSVRNESTQLEEIVSKSKEVSESLIERKIYQINENSTIEKLEDRYILRTVNSILEVSQDKVTGYRTEEDFDNSKGTRVYTGEEAKIAYETARRKYITLSSNDILRSTLQETLDRGNRMKIRPDSQKVTWEKIANGNVNLNE